MLWPCFHCETVAGAQICLDYMENLVMGLMVNTIHTGGKIMKSKSYTSWFVLLFILFLIPEMTVGAERLVNEEGTGAYASIQAAILASSDGDVVLLEDGTFDGPGNYDIDFSGLAITVRSLSGNPEDCIIDCQRLGRGFIFQSGEDTTSVVMGLTIERGWSVDGRGGAGILCDSSKAKVIRNILRDNYAQTGSGGAISSIWSSVIVGNEIVDNVSNGSGGGIRGGGIVVYNMISGNRASNNGGGISGGIVAGSDYVAHNVISNNIAHNGGGVATVSWLASNIIVDNHAAYDGIGGGIYRCGGIYNCWIVGNDAGEVGGVFISDVLNPYVDIFNCTIVNNYSEHLTMGTAVHGRSYIRYSVVESQAPSLLNSAIIYDSAMTVPPSYCTSCLNGVPSYQDGPGGDYYLSASSDCVDAGPVLAASICFETGVGEMCMSHYTTQIDESLDKDEVDYGFHMTRIGPVYVPDDYLTIQSAIDSTFSGAHVIVRSATYDEHINFLGKNIRLESESGPETTIINGDHTSTVVVFNSGENSDASIEGFTIQNGYGNSGSAGGIGCSYSSPTILNNVIRWNEASIGAGIYCGMSMSTIIGNTIYENTYVDSGIDDSGGGIACWGDDVTPVQQLIENNTLYANSNEFGGALSIGGVQVTLRNNIIAENVSAAGPVHAFGSTYSIDIAGCDVHGNSSGDFVGDLGGLSSGNISIDPLFCSPGSDDYTLHANSQCTDTHSRYGLIGSLGVGCSATLPVEIRVDPGGSADFTTIQPAMDLAQVGDTVILDSSDFNGTLVGNHDLNFRGKAITVRAGGALTMIDVGGVHGTPRRGFIFESGETASAVLQGITIAHGYEEYGGGIHISDSSPTLNDVGVIFSEASGDGGGIYITDNASPTLNDCSVNDNTAAGKGGGVYINGAAPSFDDCGFRDNTAQDDGGAIYVRSAAPAIQDCRFLGNQAHDNGGGLYLWDAGGASIAGCLFSGNTSAGYGGGAHFHETDTDLSSSTFFGNSGLSGGGISVRGGSSVELFNVLIAFNSGGSGVYLDGATSTCDLTCSDIYGNAGGDWTGDIAGQSTADGNFSFDPLFCDAAGGDFTLAVNSYCAEENRPICGQVGAFTAECTSINSTHYITAEGSGDFPTIQAAINASALRDTIELADETFSGEGNRDLDFGGRNLTIRSEGGDPAACIIDCQGLPGAQHRGFDFHLGETTASVVRDIRIINGYHDYGGGIACSNSSPQLINVVVADCGSPLSGGGLYLAHGSSAEMTDCEIRDNVSGARGGGLCIYLASPVLDNCVVSGNSAADNGGGVFGQGTSSSITDCSLLNNSTGSNGGGLYLWDADDSVVTGCVLVGNSCAYRGGGANFYSTNTSLSMCTFVDNSGPSGSGVSVRGGSAVTMDNVLLAFNTGGSEGLYLEAATSTCVLTCSDIYGNDGGNWTIDIDSQLGPNGNIEDDPQFCDVATGDFTIREGSPCSDAVSACGQIGALGIGCMPQVDYDIMGLYLDTGATIAQGTFDPYEEFDLYLVIKDPSDESGILGWECSLPVPSSVFLTEFEYYGDSPTVVGPAPSYMVGMASPLPNAQNIALARFRFMPTNIDLQEFFLTPAAASPSFDPASPGYLSGASILVPTVPSSGSFELPVFVLNPGTAVTRTVNPDGSGDYGSIREAVAGASSGDTIILGNGTFTGPNNRDVDPGGLDLTIRSGDKDAGACIIDCENQGRGFYFHSGEGAAFLLQGVTIQNGTGVNGGAILCENASSPTIRDCVLLDNSAGSGGAIYAIGQSIPTIDGSAFAGNTATYGGGGLGIEFSVEATPFSIVGCTFFDNSATYGGGIYSSKGHVTVSRSILWLNEAGNRGSQVSHENTNESLTIECSDIDGGAADINAEGTLVYNADNVRHPPAFCAPEANNLELAANSPCLPGNNACGQLMGAFDQGCAAVSEVPEVLPQVTSLDHNQPNPFNPMTVIHFALSEPQHVRLAVFDLKGRRVRSLVDESRSAGHHDVTWLGRDDEGTRVASGVYFYRLEAGDYLMTRSMMLIK
jgi:parallel beta-helix repeat protein/predicted outer membrane repeat protein